MSFDKTVADILDEVGQAYHNNYPDHTAHNKAFTAITKAHKEEVNKAVIKELKNFASGGKFRKPDNELDRGIQIGYDTHQAEIEERIAELEKENDD